MKLTCDQSKSRRGFDCRRRRLRIAAFAAGMMAVATALKATDPPSTAPGAAMPASTRLLERLDLQRPELAAVRAPLEAGDATEAARAWRAIAVARLRRSQLGTFDHHLFHFQSRKLLADHLVGIIGPEDFGAQAPSFEKFRDLYGISGPPGLDRPIDWTPSTTEVIDVLSPLNYGSFNFAIPLAARYWETGDSVYGKKWFDVVSDYALRQRPLMERCAVALRPRGNSPWIVSGDTCLAQSWKVTNLIRCLACFAKALPSTDQSEIPAWGKGLVAIHSAPSERSIDLFDVEQFAAIVLSLTGDDPPLLLQMYEALGAPPNQRCHGLFALLMIASQFPEVKGMQEVRRRAGAAMKEHVEGSFYQDGGMLEQSLNYNLGDAERFRQLGRMLRGPDQPAWLEPLRTRLALFDRMLIALRTPAGELPVIGNNTANPPPLWRSEANPDDQSRRQSSALAASTRDRLAFTSVAFPFAGYYVQRGSWDWQSSYLFFMNSRPAIGHHSMDNLAVELHAFGRPMLVRGGPPSYGVHFLPENRQADADAINDYFGERSSYKINTVLVDGYPQIRAAAAARTPSGKPIAGRWRSSQTFDFVDGTYDLGYGDHRNAATHICGVVHHRAVIFLRTVGCWAVVDTLQSQGLAARRYTQIWKLPPFADAVPGKSAGVCGFTRNLVVIDEAGFHTVDPHGPNLWAFQASNAAPSYKLHFGETDPFRGWYARQIGDLLPAADIHANFQGPKEVVIVTLFAPGADVDSPCAVRPPGEPLTPNAEAGVTATTPDGTTITVVASPKGEASLRAGLVEARARLLITQADAGAVQGLVIGCSSIKTSEGEQVSPSNPDFEFTIHDGTIEILGEIGIPSGFSWHDTQNDSQPVYWD